MKTIAGFFGILMLFFVGSILAALAGLPHWLTQVIVLLLLLALLRWADRALTGGSGFRAVGWVLRGVWAKLTSVVDRQLSIRLPQPPPLPAPVPVSRSYRYLVPGSSEVIEVAIRPAAVYDYFDPTATRYPHAYIGKTVDSVGRHEQHVEDRRDFVDLQRDVQWYPCECVALAVEQAAIRQLRPVRNIAMNTGR